MRIHIIGAGEVGRHLAQSLSGAGHEITVIEADSRYADDLRGQVDANVMCGDGCSASFLAESGVGRCELFLALTSCNNANLVGCAVAKKLGAKTTICRVHPDVQREEWMFNYRKEFHADHIFSSERLSAIEFAKFICNPTSLLVEEIARGKIELQQITVESGCTAEEKTLRNLSPPGRVRVATVHRKGHSFIPNAETHMLAGDRLTIFGEPRQLRSFVTQMQGRDGPPPESRNVVIFGAGEYGYSLAEMLQGWNCKIRILEKDTARCEWLAPKLQNTTIINVDATSLSELREEQVGDADFFVATSPNDEDNVMTCLQARNLGARHCLSLIHRSDYADAIRGYREHLGIMAAVSPREAARLDLIRFVTADKFHLVKHLDEGDIIELAVPENASIDGKRIREIDWPNGVVVIALIHETQAVFPKADDVVQAGDNLYALVSPESKRRFIKLVSRRR